jgi:hypothetical protein
MGQDELNPQVLKEFNEFYGSDKQFDESDDFLWANSELQSKHEQYLKLQAPPPVEDGRFGK